MRRVERGLIERVEAALETVVLLTHAAHDRSARRGYRRLAEQADEVLAAVEALRLAMGPVLVDPPRDELLFEIRQELALRSADGIRAAESRSVRQEPEVLLVGARVRHGGGPPRRWVPAARTLRRLHGMAEPGDEASRLVDGHLASLWNALVAPGE